MKETPYLGVEIEDSAGHRLIDRVYVTPTAMWRLRQLWEAAGLAWGDAGGMADEQALVGRMVHVTVIDEPYGDRVYKKVTEWSPPVASDIPTDPRPTSGGGGPPADDDIPF